MAQRTSAHAGANHPTAEELTGGLHRLIESPSDSGTVAMIVARPEIDQRQEPETAQLQPGAGLIGDNHVVRGNPTTPDGRVHPEAEITIMNVHAVDLVAGGDRSRWSLAGDQFFVDLDLSLVNLPPGTRLSIGSAELEVTAKPHTGCAKFAQRFGMDAARWVNSDRNLRIRGINARVVAAGSVSVGDTISKLD